MMNPPQKCPNVAPIVLSKEIAMYLAARSSSLTLAAVKA